jgi:outer membrane protein OmpA-like peptidoglycan-associated protein
MSARRLLALLVLPLLLCACGKPRNVVQLLADPSGHVGRVEVRTPAGMAELTQAGCAVRVADAKSAPTPPEDLSAAESEQLFGMAKRALPTQPVRFILYFETDSIRLTPESKALLADVLATARQRDSHDIAVVGHASRQGDESINIALSRKRAEFVRDQLARVGVDPQYMDVDSHGSANPLVESRRANEPKNRRVEVTVR